MNKIETVMKIIKKKGVVRGITDGGVLFFILYIYLDLLLDNVC